MNITVLLNLQKAERIIYSQLKHSNARQDKHFTPSELKQTLKGFAARYSKFVEEYDAANVLERLQFHFVSNRPVDDKIKTTVSDLAAGNGSYKGEGPLFFS